MRTELEALPWVLPRPRLVGLLDQRWHTRVVTVVAGPGFGKSTAIALAVGSEDPARRDHYVKLDVSASSATALMARLTQTCADIVPDAEDPSAFLAALSRSGEHCLIFDDVHELDETGRGLDTLQAIVDGLPPTVHVVLSSRRPIPLRLARRRAGGQVLDIDEADLTYSAEELHTIAALTDTPVEELSTTGGWPALVSLTVRQGYTGALDFLAEEIIEDLGAATCDALMAASLAGGADPEMLRQVTGFDGDLRQVASGVPLVTIDRNLVLTPHALWSEALHAQMEPGERERVLARLVDAHLGRGRHGDALQLALNLSDGDSVAAVVRELCAPGHIGFDVDDIDRWLTAAPAGFDDLPEGRLLRALSMRRSDPTGDDTRLALEAVVAEMREAGETDCEVVATSELALVYRWRGEAERLPPIVARLFELEAGGHRAAASLATFARGAILDQMGDTTGALEAIKHLRRGDLHDSWIAFVEFLRSHLLLLLGRVRESHDAARRSVALGPPGYSGGWCAERSTAWHLGVTRDRVDRLPIADEVSGASIVEQVWIGSWFGVKQAMAGRLEEAGRNVAVAEAALHAHSPPELVAFVTWARVTLAVAEHDEDRARRELSAFLDEHPIESPLAVRFSARAPALVDQLVGDRLDPAWREAIAGPWQRDMLAISRSLTLLRDGETVERWPDPSSILCALPLPWAVEMAVLGCRTGAAPAAELARLIVDVAGADAVAAEIDRHLAPDLRPDAERLFTGGGSGELPRIRLLGPVAVTGDDELVGVDELRRLRVREILAFVALQEPVRRDVVAAALWPDHDRERSAANIRVNLSYLGRIRTADGARLVVESSNGLALGDGLTTDVAEFDEAVADAAAAHRAGYDVVAVGLYERALRLVEGLPLVDTRHSDWFEHEANRLEIAIVRAASAGAALALQVDRPAAAAMMAQIAVELDPYNEDAWLDLIRAHQGTGDHVAATAAAARFRLRIDELGMEPSPAAVDVLARL